MGQWRKIWQSLNLLKLEISGIFFNREVYDIIHLDLVKIGNKDSYLLLLRLFIFDKRNVSSSSSSSFSYCYFFGAQEWLARFWQEIWQNSS